VRPRTKIVNKGSYDTRFLQRFCSAVARRYRRGPAWGRCELTVEEGKRGTSVGWYAVGPSYRGGAWRARITLPRPVLDAEFDRLLPAATARQLLHGEPMRRWAGTRALADAMRNVLRVEGAIRGGPPVRELMTWAEREFGEHVPVRQAIAAPKPKPTADPRAVRYERLVAREAGWQARAKRASTALRKIRKQRKYYERLGYGPKEA
jgi:hypothetical protein